MAKPQSYGSADAIETHDKPWTTGFFKTPIAGPVAVSLTQIAGDGQADLKHHGGPDKAILAYSADHYPDWRERLAMPQMPFGAFGENLTITGLTEESVCIGDVYTVGPLVVEVSQPRQPCWKLARRWRRNELVPMVIANGRTGWYLRVLEPAAIVAGLPVALARRPFPDWPVARCNHILHHQRDDARQTAELAALPPLAQAWKDELNERLERLAAKSTINVATP